MTPGRLWYHVRRSRGRDPRAVLNEALGWRRLSRWRNPWRDDDPQEVPIHVVAGREHLLMTAWMLSSFHLQTRRCWRVYLHDDGSIGYNHRLHDLRRLFRIRLIPRSQADPLIEVAAHGQPGLRNLRASLPLMLKLVDVRIVNSAPKVLLLDPDVLFFGRPERIIEWAGHKDDHTMWFNAEPDDPSYIDAATVEAHVGKPAWKGLNSGLACLPLNAVDLARCEQWLLAFSELHGTTWATNWRVEQTLYALCAAAHGKGGLLPGGQYEVSLRSKRNENGISRHYIGAVRDRFWAEGVQTLKGQLRP